MWKVLRRLDSCRDLRKCLNTTPRYCTTGQNSALRDDTVRLDPANADNLMEIGIRKIFTPEHDMLRETARRFSREMLQPNEKRWGEQGYPDPEIFKESAKWGLNGIGVPEDDHGVGGDLRMATLVWEEGFYVNSSAMVSIGLHNYVNIPYVRLFGTQAQKDKYLPRMISGDCIASIAMTEPGAGSDLQGIRTTAVRDGDDWILNGSKTFITNGYNCGLAIVVARTDAAAKSAAKGLSLFLVEKDTPGFVKGKPLKKYGLHASDTAELFFDDVRLPADSLLGKENRGFNMLMAQLPMERFGTGFASVAWSEFMYEVTREYVKQRKVFGRPLANLQTVYHKMAELKTNICVAREFADQTLMAAEEGHLGNVNASMVKLWGTKVANEVAYDCVQLHGGMGYMADTEVTRAAASVRVKTIYGGANEIMKELIGRDIVIK